MVGLERLHIQGFLNAWNKDELYLSTVPSMKSVHSTAELIACGCLSNVSSFQISLGLELHDIFHQITLLEHLF